MDGKTLARRLIEDCRLAAKCLAETNSFESGQAIFNEIALLLETGRLVSRAADQTQDELAEAIAELRRLCAAQPDRPSWTLTPPDLDRVILDAVLSGQLVPATTAPAPEAASDAAREERTMTLDAWRDERRWQAALAAMTGLSASLAKVGLRSGETQAQADARWCRDRADALLAAMEARHD